jgi:acyl-CoA synthetase (NDP forming)
MDFFFKPKGVAVIGASPSPNKGGNIIISNMQKGYGGKIYPVNPRYEEINDLTCYPFYSGCTRSGGAGHCVCRGKNGAANH